MCQVKPYPRCSRDAYNDWEAASKSLADITNPDAIRDGDEEKLNRQIATKQQIFDKRDREFSVASLSGVKNAKANLYAHENGTLKEPLTPEQIVKHRAVIERYNQISADPELLDGVKREAFLRKKLGKYEELHRLNPNLPVDTSPIGGNPRLTADALTFFSTITPEVKRDLTPQEQEALEQAQANLGTEDYLPVEKAKGKTVKKQAKKKFNIARPLDAFKADKPVLAPLREESIPKPLVLPPRHRSMTTPGSEQKSPTRPGLIRTGGEKRENDIPASGVQPVSPAPTGEPKEQWKPREGLIRTGGENRANDIPQNAGQGSAPTPLPALPPRHRSLTPPAPSSSTGEPKEQWKPREGLIRAGGEKRENDIPTNSPAPSSATPEKIGWLEKLLGGGK